MRLLNQDSAVNSISELSFKGNALGGVGAQQPLFFGAGRYLRPSLRTNKMTKK
jgi:hypothetical protein